MSTVLLAALPLFLLGSVLWLICLLLWNWWKRPRWHNPLWEFSDPELSQRQKTKELKAEMDEAQEFGLAVEEPPPIVLTAVIDPEEYDSGDLDKPAGYFALEGDS